MFDTLFNVVGSGPVCDCGCGQNRSALKSTTTYASDTSSKRGRKPPTLIVLDMQPEFEPSYNYETFVGVGDLMKKAIFQTRPIVMVEYRGAGRTYPQLRNLIQSYPYAKWVEKDEDDGSVEIIHSCNEEGFPTQNFVVCGVNVDACVLRTVRGLAQKLPEASIKVVRHACSWEIDGTDPFDGFKQFTNVSLVGRKCA